MTTPDLDHERIEALIAADVLDGLDEPDRREMEALLSEHGPGCQTCRRPVGACHRCTAVSVPPAAIQRPSGLYATTLRPLGASSSATFCSVATSQTRAVLSSLAVMSR